MDLAAGNDNNTIRGNDDQGLKCHRVSIADISKSIKKLENKRKLERNELKFSIRELSTYSCLKSNSSCVTYTVEHLY